MHEGRFLWVLLNSGSCGAYAFNHDPETLRGVHSYRQPVGYYFPTPGGTFAGESLPGAMTWARAYITKGGVLWMDIGRGEVGEAAAARCATRGGKARRASGRSWRPTWASRRRR